MSVDHSDLETLEESKKCLQIVFQYWSLLRFVEKNEDLKERQ